MQMYMQSLAILLCKTKHRPGGSLSWVHFERRATASRSHDGIWKDPMAGFFDGVFVASCDRKLCLPRGNQSDNLFVSMTSPSDKPTFLGAPSPISASPAASALFSFPSALRHLQPIASAAPAPHSWEFLQSANLHKSS